MALINIIHSKAARGIARLSRTAASFFCCASDWRIKERGCCLLQMGQESIFRGGCQRHAGSWAHERLPETVDGSGRRVDGIRVGPAKPLADISWIGPTGWPSVSLVCCGAVSCGRLALTLTRLLDIVSGAVRGNKRDEAEDYRGLKGQTQEKQKRSDMREGNADESGWM